MKRIIQIILLIGLSFSGLFSETNTIDRQFTPIILKNHSAPLSGILRAEWSAWAFHSESNSWQQVPFQMDDVKSNGGYEHTEASIDPELKPEDEIVIMPGDFGDKAVSSDWLVDAESQNAPRIELEFTDPLDISKKGWVYLYKNVTNQMAVDGYFEYSPPPNPSVSAADTVFSRYYTLAHQNNGFFNYLTFPENPTLDLLDRLKMRFDAEVKITSEDININENSLTAKTENQPPVSAFPGQVRFFRDVRDQFKVSILGFDINSDLPANLQYFPYSIQGQVDLDIGGAILGQIRVNFIRISMDFSPNASGMTFYSNKNRDGYTIDGVPETPEALVDDPFGLNWLMATGDQGTVVMMLQMPEVDRGNTTLFYYDNSSGGTKDGSDDTGDMKSYGDMGMWSKTTSDGLSVSKINFQYSFYFINQNLQSQSVADFGDLLTEQHQNPLTVTASEQTYVPTSVADAGIQPESFELHDAYPNPYLAGQGNVTFSFSNINLQNNVELTIYNVLGQKVKQFNNIQLLRESRQSLKWDGRDLNGQPVSQGIYFYSLTNNQQVLTGKLVVLN